MLTTEHLELRPLPPRAAAALPYARDQAAREVRTQLSSDWPQEDLVDLLPRQAAMSSEAVMWGIWVIIDRAEEMIVGDIGFFGAPPQDGTVAIGYGIVPAHRRRGYATEAGGALVAWALRQPGVQAIVASCAEDNEASIRTLRRVGFDQTDRNGHELRWRFRPPVDASAG